MPLKFRHLLLLGLVGLTLAPRLAHAVDEPRLKNYDFLGAQSCSTSGCHGGGQGHHHALPWLREKDPHNYRKGQVLAFPRSKQIGEALKIPDTRTDAQCTVCHAPMESVAPSRLAGDLKTPDKGVSCEACHGPAENWIRFHTRTDITRDQRLAAGMREMRDLYNRANTCVACHLYISPALAKAGHPPIYFELAVQQKMRDREGNDNPHWTERDAEWLEPRAWLVGQATSLRELAWRQKTDQDETVGQRVDALRWVLRLSDQGANIPAQSDLAGTQAAADRLAKTAQKSDWNKSSTLAQLRKFTAVGPEFRKAGNADLQREQGIALGKAINAFWTGLMANGMTSTNFTQSFVNLQQLLQPGVPFDNGRFADALTQLQVSAARDLQ